MNFVALDVETANHRYSSICQIGVAFFADGEYKNSWETLLNPEEYFQERNIRIHEINEEMVKDSPTFPSICKELHEYLTNTIVVTHSPFDRTAMVQIHQKYNIDLPEIRWLDTTKVVRRTWKDRASKGYGLQDICEFLKIEFKHHDAAEDARATGKVLLKAIQKTGFSIEDWVVRVTHNHHANSHFSIGEGNPDGDLYGQSIVFTGQLIISRKEAATHAAHAGCNVQNSVTKKTTLLVVGDQDLKQLAGHEKSSKHRRAEELIEKGIPIRILGETDFYSMVSPEIAKTIMQEKVSKEERQSTHESRPKEGVQMIDGELSMVIDFSDVFKDTTKKMKPIDRKLFGAIEWDPENNLDEISSLLEKGADVNSKDEEGRTSLSAACMWKADYPDIIKRLIEAHADPNSTDELGDTPLLIAACSGNSEVINILLDAGANPNAKNKDGDTVLHCAAQNTDPNVTSLFINLELDVNARNNSKQTPLFMAAEHNDSTEAIACLINAGADLNARDDQDQTPLFEAVEWNDNIEVISFLISNGADPTAINDCEESLLEYCENRDGSVKAVQKIIRNAVKNKSN